MENRAISKTGIVALLTFFAAGCEPSGGNIYAVNKTSVPLKLFAHWRTSKNPDHMNMLAVIPANNGLTLKNALPHRFSSLFSSYASDKGEKRGDIYCEAAKIDKDLEQKGYLELVLK